MDAETGITRSLDLLEKQLTVLEKEDLHRQLVFFINDLILNDFNKLVQLLYRVDVHERKLKALLQQHPRQDAADTIAALLVDRQEEKIRLRQSFPKPSNIPEEEKW